VNIFVATLLVLGLVSALAWLVRRGPLAQLAAKGKPVSIERAIPLGDRRSLVIVTVEGRRLLLGMTPTHISLVTELRSGAQP
jgi:flagellar protein FliO/FliZ